MTDADMIRRDLARLSETLRSVAGDVDPCTRWEHGYQQGYEEAAQWVDELAKEWGAQPGPAGGGE